MLGAIIGILFGLYMVAAVVNVVGVVIGALFSVGASLIGEVFSGVFSLEGLAAGCVIGFLAFRWLKKRNAETAES